MLETHSDPVRTCLYDAARQVLETMFFITVEEPDPSAPLAEPCWWLEVDFRGNPSGCFYLGISDATAATAAANFLGAEPGIAVGREETVNVLREMANMICGATLSRLENGRSFELSSPRLLECAPLRQPDAACVLPLDCGGAEVRLWLASSYA